MIIYTRTPAVVRPYSIKLSRVERGLLAEALRLAASRHESQARWAAKRGWDGSRHRDQVNHERKAQMMLSLRLRLAEEVKP